jgi:hypothetical protein
MGTKFEFNKGNLGDISELYKVTFMGSGHASYQAQLGTKVDPNIVNMHPTQDQFRARLASRARENAQLAAVFVTLDSIDFLTADDPFFTEGKCPPDVQESKSQDSITKKSYGVQGGLTNVAIAAMANECNAQAMDKQVMDEVERKLKVLDIAFRNGEDWAMINANAGTNVLAFDGIDELTEAVDGSLVVDLGGTQITKADINQIVAIQLLRGVRVTMILSNPLMINFIQQLFYDQVNGVEFNPVGEQPDPYSFVTVPTPAGTVDLVGDPHVGVTYAGSGDDYTTSVFVLTEEHNGEDLLYMDYLIPQSMLPDYVFHNGENCTSRGLGMYAHGALVSRAPVAQSKITNAGFTSSGDLNATVVALTSLVV